MRIGEAARQAFEAGDDWDRIAAAVLRACADDDEPAGETADRLAETLASWSHSRAMVGQAIEAVRVAVDGTSPAVVGLCDAVAAFVAATDRMVGLEVSSDGR